MTDLAEGEPVAGRRRLRPNQVVVIIGTVAAVVTSLSYAAATTFGFHDDSPIRREEFRNISDGLQVLFYIATTVLIFGAGWMLSLRVRNWERGTRTGVPPRRGTSVGGFHGTARPVSSGAGGGAGDSTDPDVVAHD